MRLIVTHQKCYKLKAFVIHSLKEVIKIKENYIIPDPCPSSKSLTVHISVSLLVKSLRLSNSLKQR